MATVREYGEEEKHGEESLTDECKVLLSTLPNNKGWVSSSIYRFQGFWFNPACFRGIFASDKHFQTRDDGDIILATFPKSGTTWLKAMAFAIVNRSLHSNFCHHPLMEHNPHGLVPFLESELYEKIQVPDLGLLPSPRIFATHLPYDILPHSVRESGSCRIVYLCRNPRDNFVSLWTFTTKVRPKTLSPITMEEAFKLFCSGVSPYGPYWDHTLDYWKESLKSPQRVLFLKYEDLVKDPLFHIKRLAHFLAFPFSLDEERGGVVDDIVKLCSFQNLSNLEVNKTGRLHYGIAHRAFFRQGKVGDWENYLTPWMVQQLDGITNQKFEEHGLTFDVS